MIPIHEDDLSALIRQTAEDQPLETSYGTLMGDDMGVAIARAVLAHLTTLGVGVPDPVGVSEIADRANTNRRGVDAWRERQPDFPAPRWHIGGSPVWEWTDVLTWGRATGRVRDGDRWAPLRRRPAEAAS